MKLILFFILTLFFIGCNKPEKQDKIISEDSSIWIKDSLGCMKKRNFDIAEKLIMVNKLKGSSTEIFKMIFGKPNETNQDRHFTTYTYYVESFCNHNSIEKNSDKCYAIFTFDKNKLIDSGNYICE